MFAKRAIWVCGFGGHGRVATNICDNLVYDETESGLLHKGAVDALPKLMVGHHKAPVVHVMAKIIHISANNHPLSGSSFHTQRPHHVYFLLHLWSLDQLVTYIYYRLCSYASSGANIVDLFKRFDVLHMTITTYSLHTQIPNVLNKLPAQLTICRRRPSGGGFYMYVEIIEIVSNKLVLFQQQNHRMVARWYNIIINNKHRLGFKRGAAIWV